MKNPVDHKGRPRKVNSRHDLVPTRTMSGKHVEWVCALPKCHYVDTGGRLEVFGCPKPPPMITKGW